MEMTVEDILKIMKQFFENIDKELNKLVEELSIKEQEQQDILHYIENNNLNAGGYSKAGKLLKKVRQERRDIKDNIDRVNHIKNFTDKYNKKLIVGDIVQTLKGLNTITRKQQNPVYIRRTNIIESLEEKIKGEDINQDTDFVQVQEEQPTDIN